jgi:hypothetical protein
MPRNWIALAEASEGVYIADDFKQALYQLVVHQCLYARFNHHGTAYRLISTYRREFEEAVELMGLRLGFNERLEFCYVTPDVVKHTPLDMQETLFLLVLRQIYHLRGSAGELTDEGDAIIGPEELVTTYHSMTGRTLDTKNQSVIKGLVKFASKSGLARLLDAPDGDPQPFAIAILPAIAEVLSEHVVNRFGAHLKSGLVGHKRAIAPVDKEAAREDA